MNPYVLLAALALIVGSYVYGRYDGRQIEQAKQDRAVQAVEEASDAMQKKAAEAISNIEIHNKTIRAEVQREIVEKPVYRDCVADPDILRSINAAKGRSESAGDSELPGAPPVH